LTTASISEATGNALAIARLLEPHAARVVVAATKELRAITEAKVKTDRRDARTLARLLAAGLLSGCWLPDERTRALRRRLARRAQLVRQRTRCKNEVHAVLMRNLKGRPPMTDVFGKRGRAWLAELELPPTSARRSRGAFARSTSSTARSRSSNERSPSMRSPQAMSGD
jgi:transposase